VRGYIADGESGRLVNDLQRDLPAIIDMIERDPQAAAAWGAAAYQRYCRYFSRDAGGAALGRIIEPLLAR
jgi:hypothetical protein